MAINYGLVQAQPGAVPSVSTAGGTTQASGSTFVIAVHWNRGSTFTSVADSKSNTYTQIGAELDDAAGGYRARLYYCENGTGGASHTATLTTSAGSGAAVIHFIEITGGLTSGILDQHDQRITTSSPFALAAGITTTQADELLLTFLAGDSFANPATHAESGLGSSTIVTDQTDGVSYWPGAVAVAIKSATGTFNPSWTESGASTASVFLATFKASAAAGTTRGIPFGNIGTAFNGGRTLVGLLR